MHGYVWVCAHYSTYVCVSEENVQSVFSFYFWVAEIKFRLSTLMTALHSLSHLANPKKSLFFCYVLLCFLVTLKFLYIVPQNELFHFAILTAHTNPNTPPIIGHPP